MIHIACNIDSNYVMQCCTTLVSVMYNNQDEQISFHIISNNMSQENKNAIRGEIKKFSQSVFFYDILSKDLSSYSIYGNSHISMATYYRLLVADILPKNIHKLIYLDCDLVVNGSIKEFWNIDVSRYAVAAVEDMWSGKLDNYTRLSYSQEFTYFNAGVLLINVDYWKQLDISHISMEYAQQHPDSLIFNDQDVLNALLHDKKLLIPFRWNIQDGFLRKKKRIRPQALPVLMEELKHPVIIHYTGHRKPWLYLCQHPYQSLFFKYLDMTRWKGIRPTIPLSWKIKVATDKILYALHLKAEKYDYKNCIRLC